MSVNANTEHVVVAMSGGVDSSVAAALLVEQGYKVTGIMMRLWSEPGLNNKKRDNRCCTRDQMLDAHFIAKKLGIPFEFIDATDVFKERIVDQFVDDYSLGITPNPCLACNRQIRFGFLLNEALKHGAQYLATGHYARAHSASDGLVELLKGTDPAKDQSYVLSRVTQAQLRHAMFPVGQYTKAEVRELAKDFGLPVASKQDSQDLCFIADGDYRRFLRDNSGTAVFAPGDIRLLSGQIVGEHKGLADYTVGQRKGLGISWSEPLYVISKESSSNSLVVGTRDEMGTSTFLATDMNWIAGATPDDSFNAEVKIRYQADPVQAMIRLVDEHTAEINLEFALYDVTPGQGAVIYSGERVIGSGLIAVV